MFVNESLAKGLVNRIFRTLHNRMTERKHVEIASHRKMCKRIKSECQKRAAMVFIAERNAQSNRWEVIWGEWNLFSSQASLFRLTQPEDFTQIAFDLTFTNRNTKMGCYIFFVVMSRHALERLIMRCGEEIKNPSGVNKFLKRITRQLVFAALELSRRNLGTNPEEYTGEEISRINSDIKPPETQGYTIINGYYIPLSYGLNFHKQGGTFARYITIKTIMPDTYDSAVNALRHQAPLIPSDSLYDYLDVFPFLK